MIRDPEAPITRPDREAALLRVLEDVAARRGRGEAVVDAEVVNGHRDLLPDLIDRLRALRRAEEALAIASGSSARATSDSMRPSEGAVGSLAESWTIPGYELCEQVGRGAMGIVHRAVEAGSKREVAIKFLHDGPFVGKQDRIRFEREAEILAQLRHPNIVAIHDTGWAQGRFYLVMNYIAGRPLDAHVEATSREPRAVLSLFVVICDAVHAAHLRGVIHRDLKPSNIRVDEDGEPHLLDFGLAKLESDEASMPHAASMTMTGQFVGSLPWASPEQAEGAQDKIDLRTDVYALGVILYQLLTGRFPYAVEGNIRDVVDRILTVEPTRPSTLVRSIDAELETIVLKCLAKDRSRRYQSAGELAAEIRRYLAGEPIEAKRDSGWYLLRKLVRRHRTTVGVAAAFVLLLVGFSATMAVLYTKEQRESVRARRTLAFLQDMLFQASSQRLGSDATLAEVLDEASARMQDAFSSEPQVAAALHFTLGSAYETIWEKQRAVPHLRKALELQRRLLGSDDDDTLRTMTLLGMVLAEQGVSESIPLQREALAIRIRKYGPRSRFVADGLGELAFALWAGSDAPSWDEVEATYRDAVALYRATVSGPDAYFARVLTGLGSLRSYQHRFEEALSAYEEALSMARATVGDRHQFAVECQIGLADALAGVGRRKDAVAGYQDALTKAPKLFGVRAVPAIMRKLAALQQEEGNLDAAEVTLFDALADVCRHEVAARPSEAEELRAHCGGLRNPRAAERDAAYRAVVLRLHAKHQQTLDTARNLMSLAKLRQAQGSHAEAVALYQPALSLLANSGARALRTRVTAYADMAESLAALGRTGEAEAALLEALDGCRKVVGDDADVTRMARERLTAFRPISERSAPSGTGNE